MRAREFWQRTLPREYAASTIHHDYKIGENETCASGSISIPFRLNTCSRIREMTDNDPYLIQTLLCCNLSIVLFKYTGSRSVIFGLPTWQDKAELNILPYAAEVDNQSNIIEFINHTQIQLETLYQHQEEDFDALHQLLCENEERNIGPLYDIVLYYSAVNTPVMDTKGSITLSFELIDDYIQGEIWYKQAIYSTNTIVKFSHWFAEALHALVNNVNGKISAIDILSLEEIYHLDKFCFGKQKRVSKQAFNHNVFQTTALKYPQRTALVSGDTAMSYGSLRHLSNLLALEIASQYQDRLVGIFTERSFDMIVGVLGVLMSHCTYLPIDPTYPTDRLSNMLNSVDVPCILTQKKFERLLKRIKPSIHLIFIEDIPGTQGDKITPSGNYDWENTDIAYAIFTSGSTGTPKCAKVTHAGWANLLTWFNTTFSINHQDKCLLVSSFGFDITQRALMMPLIAGAELHLYNRSEYDPSEILSIVEKKGITVIHCTPSTFYPILDMCEGSDYTGLSSLKYLFLGGEPIQASRLKGWAQSKAFQCSIVNVYGVTECTDVSAYYTLQHFSRYEVTGVPIGQPIDNTALFIVNDHLDMVLFGMDGELLIGGTGVGAGYINDDALTHSKFITHRYGDTEHRLYRTGDMVRFNEEGILLYTGRKDFQVKIRGHRIDLGDLEAHINSYPCIKESVVITSEDVNRGAALIAYATIDENKLARENNGSIIQGLWKYLRDKLPSHMVPDQFGILPRMPLNAHGKLDRSALKTFPSERIHAELKEFTQPTGSLEQYLYTLFKQVLNVEELSTTDNFFETGGHSLSATQLIALINKEKKVDLRVVNLISHPTVRSLADHIQHLTITLI